tara:strand:- start:20771 stop:21427 length:657 start_codon:yes stop_codon:yes gene_type:complete
MNTGYNWDLRRTFGKAELVGPALDKLIAFTRGKGTNRYWLVRDGAIREGNNPKTKHWEAVEEAVDYVIIIFEGMAQRLDVLGYMDYRANDDSYPYLSNSRLFCDLADLKHTHYLLHTYISSIGVRTSLSVSDSDMHRTAIDAQYRMLRIMHHLVTGGGAFEQPDAFGVEIKKIRDRRKTWQARSPVQGVHELLCQLPKVLMIIDAQLDGISRPPAHTQ